MSEPFVYSGGVEVMVSSIVGPGHPWVTEELSLEQIEFSWDLGVLMTVSGDKNQPEPCVTLSFYSVMYFSLLYVLLP